MGRAFTRVQGPKGPPVRAQSHGHREPQGARHVRLQALPPRSSLTSAEAGAARVPGLPARPTPGAFLARAAEAQPRFSPGLGLQSPGPERTEISHDPLPPTVRIWELQGRAPQDFEAALGRGWPPGRLRTGAGTGSALRSLCLEPPFTLYYFCLSVVSQLCGSNLARPPEALVLWLALLWGWLSPTPPQKNRNTRKSHSLNIWPQLRLKIWKILPLGLKGCFCYFRSLSWSSRRSSRDWLLSLFLASKGLEFHLSWKSDRFWTKPALCLLHSVRISQVTLP